MDKSNYSELINLAGNSKNTKKIKLYMNLAYPGKNIDVPDPYYDGRFEEVFDLLYDASDKIIEKLTK